MPSNSEILAYRGNHCFTHVRVQGTGFGYSDNGNYIPIGFSCDENISSVPQGYNSNINAVKAFIDNNASRWTYIDSIDNRYIR